jgi:acylpyruvate hydrolase
MKLATLAVRDGTTAIVVDGETVSPIPGYSDVGALLRAGEAGKSAAHAAAGRSGQPYSERDLRPPILSPGAVFCVGLNYRAHVLEMGRELPTSPTLFSKLSRSLTGPFDNVRLTTESQQTDYEGELVVIIGTEGRNIPLKQADAHIAGYTLMNDVSMRDWQNRATQWFAGKNFERSTPTGPWLLTADEFDLAHATLTVTVNGTPRQTEALSELIFGPANLVSDISRFTTLLPGDLIATGTPGGVGHGMNPPQHLTDGDVVEVTISEIGSLRNRFVVA